MTCRCSYTAEQLISSQNTCLSVLVVFGRSSKTRMEVTLSPKKRKHRIKQEVEEAEVTRDIQVNGNVSNETEKLKKKKKRRHEETVQEETKKTRHHLPERGPGFERITIDNDEFVMIFWDSCPQPGQGEVSFEYSKADETQITGSNPCNPKVKYVGTKYEPVNLDYTTTLRDSHGKKVTNTVKLFRIKPVIADVEARNKKKEVFQKPVDDTQRFASKKVQRQRKHRKDFKIDEDEEELLALESIKAEKVEQDQEQESKTPLKSFLEATDLPVVPLRNSDAKTPAEVYQIDDVIPREHQDLLRKLVEVVVPHKDFQVKMLETLFEKHEEPDKKMICLYIDILNRALKMKGNNLKNEHALFTKDGNKTGDAVMQWFAKTITKKGSSQISWVFSNQAKDALLARILILIFMLENYKPLGIKSLTTNLGIGQKPIMTIAQQIGCHFEKMKDQSNKIRELLVFKIPLYSPKERRGRRLKR